jgi:uncharacterized protein
MSHLAAAFLNKRLGLIIMPTEKCNYRCVYCYEDFEQGRMAESVSDGIVRLLASRAPQLDHLTISWFGGEPLLAMAVIEKIMQGANSSAAEHAIQLHSGATTNGHLLTLPRLQRLCALGVTQYQITLDGPADVHNARRRQAKGAGDLATILANLHAACASDLPFAITLRIHLDEISFPRFDDLLAELGTIVEDHRVSFAFEMLGNYGRALPDTIRPMSRSRFHDAARMLEDRLAVLGKAASGADADEEHVCYAATPNSFVIRANGDVQMCTVALNAAHNAVGRIGPDGAIALNERYAQWLSGWRADDRAALQCPAKAIVAMQAAAKRARADALPSAMERIVA